MRALSCSVWDLVPWPGIEPRSPALGAQSVSQWTTREVPLFRTANIHLDLLKCFVSLLQLPIYSLNKTICSFESWNLLIAAWSMSAIPTSVPSWGHIFVLFFACLRVLNCIMETIADTLLRLWILLSSSEEWWFLFYQAVLLLAGHLEFVQLVLYFVRICAKLISVASPFQAPWPWQDSNSKTMSSPQILSRVLSGLPIAYIFYFIIFGCIKS